jgi:hypothetical protein
VTPGTSGGRPSTDHTIPYPGAAFERSIDVEVGPGATLVLSDSFATRRVARNEAWCFAQLESALRVRDAQGWLAIDRFALRGEPRWAGLGFCEDRPYFATMLIVADRGLARFCAEVDGVIPADGGATAAAALRLPPLDLRKLHRTHADLAVTVGAAPIARRSRPAGALRSPGRGRARWFGSIWEAAPQGRSCPWVKMPRPPSP